jgi:hypothetical protein
MTTVPIGVAEPHSNTLFTDKPSKHSVLKQPQEFKASVDIADSLEEPAIDDIKFIISVNSRESIRIEFWIHI